MSLMTTVTMKRAVRRRRGKGGNLWQMKLWRAFLLTLWPLLGNKPVVALAQENEAKVKARKVRVKRERARARAEVNSDKNKLVMPPIRTTVPKLSLRKVPP